ncbi:GNAT family N-acetyltransferase [Rhodobacterales bacterium LSUCC0031]|nr:GNAT family N-acetyltransferase [Rhodobacterales bacterium LSUCC0031]
MITVRPAHPLDARDMAAILAEVIAIGGTTAITGEVDAATIRDWMQDAPQASAWHVAETEGGQIVGFQWIAPSTALPPEAADIATFAKPGHQGLGIGSALFSATCVAARALGYHWISANIRADNVSGLTYYQSRGFADYGRISGYRMANGLIVDKILKRYDLD